MKSVVSVALAGISGYGGSYLNALLERSDRDGGFRLVGCVDPYAQRSPRLDELNRRRIPVYPTLDELYAQTPVDLMMLATPIQFHAPQIRAAVEEGSDVLCEKPLAATLDDAARVLAAERATGRSVAIGYQWSFSRAIGSLKRDIHRGLFGRPLRFRTIALFPRGLGYYARNAWAGRVTTDAGVPIYDSPMNNATAHYLHNLLYLLGPTRTSSATPVELQAELYRANRIDSFDTAVVRCRMPCGTELLYATSHAAPDRVGPRFRLEFERAVVTYGESDPLDEVIARFEDGRTIRYGRPEHDRCEKLWQCVDVARRGGEAACGVRAAVPHTLCVHAAYESMPEPATLDGPLVEVRPMGDDRIVVVKGLEEVLVRCYRTGALPSETGSAGWAVAGRKVGVNWPEGLDPAEAAADAGGSRRAAQPAVA